ncbi:hypothetical protein BTM451_11130 [Helicobacter pylori]
MEVYSQQTTHEEMIKIRCMSCGGRIYSSATALIILCQTIYTETAQAFSAEWIPIRPNTDVALMLGMMHYLYTSNQYDKAFIAKYTDGFDKFLPYLLGESDNAPKTLEWASQITGVGAEKSKN